MVLSAQATIVSDREQEVVMRPGLVLSSECQAAGSATRREERVRRARPIIGASLSTHVPGQQGEEILNAGDQAGHIPISSCILFD